MSGREKPLILQNGIPIPQAYDKDLGDWTEYSTEHIKAIKAELALVKAELQAIKANQLSGDQKVTLSGNIVELARGGATTITAGNAVQIYATTSNDFTHMAVGARGGSSVSIANFSFRLGEYTDDSLSPTKLFRSNTFKNEASTSFLIYGVVDVYGKRVSIGMSNLHDADIKIDSWVIYGIRGR